MNISEFNEKYKNYIEEGFEGLSIHDENVIDFLDGEFTKLIELCVPFTYAQIKLKFGMPRFYSSLPFEIERKIESELQRILK